MGHTRWATHGPKTDYNSHPHVSLNNKIMIVHNGIIDNYLEIKKLLEQNNYSFKSDTDSEILANYIEYKYLKNESIEDIIQNLNSKIIGTWGLGIMCIDEPNKCYFTRCGSPLIYYYNNDFGIVSSEISGFNNKFSNYYIIEDNELIIFNQKNNKITANSYNKKKYNINNNFIIPSSPAPYAYWLLKEIYEQPETVLKAINYGGRIVDNKIILGGLNTYKSNILDCNNIILLGCGTSYNAAIYTSKIFKQICDFNSVQVFDGAEFNNYDIPKIGKTCAVFISQSGETRDLIKCIDLCNENNIITLGVINVVDSLIAREMLCGVYTNCGPEISVASTKSYISQIIVLYLIALWVSQEKKIYDDKRIKIIKDIRTLSKDISKCLEEYNNIKSLCESINENSIFILGKNTCKDVANEGALKIKEVTYIHAEGYSSSALKHGPYSLLDSDKTVLLLCPNDKYYNNNMSIYEELKARNSKIIKISNYGNPDITISNNKTFQNMLCIIPIQLISYLLGLKFKRNIDKPRGIAKVCTTD